jgi:chemotaxis protein MotA
MKLRIREQQIIREMTLEGVVSILEGMNPHVLETKLFGFLVEANQGKDEDQEEKVVE